MLVANLFASLFRIIGELKGGVIVFSDAKVRYFLAIFKNMIEFGNAILRATGDDILRSCLVSPGAQSTLA